MFIAGWLLIPLALMQAPAPFTISTNVDLVVLDAAVKDAKGGFVSGLTKENFQIYDNGKRQTIDYFTHADIPVTVGLVIDNSGSMSAKRTQVSTAGLTFARASHPLDEMFVVTFNDRVRLGLPDEVPFTDNSEILLAAFLSSQSEGRTSLYDALAYALQHLERGRMDKKTLIVVSDGGDNASVIRWPEVMRRVQESRATIYTVGIFDADDRDRNPDVLRKLANVSGGEYYQLPEIKDIVPVCKKIASDIRTRYTLAYVPRIVESRDSVRVIKVTASDSSHKRLSVRTRSRYRMPEAVK